MSQPVFANINTTISPIHHTMSAVLVHEYSPLELSIFLGGSHIPNTIDGQTLQLLPYEIGANADTFVDQSNANAFTWGMDARYRFMLHEPSVQHYFFDSIAAGIGFYQITNFNQTGDVLQFNMPEFENYTYTLRVKSARLMPVFDLDFHPIHQCLVPFIEGGLGVASTTVSYNSIPISPIEGPGFSLPDKTSWSFAYQVGAGVKYLVNTHFALSLRYLYADMGSVDSSTTGNTTNLTTPLTIDMRTQNILFGLTYLVS